MAESILDSIKKSVGIGVDNPEFDTDIIMYANAAFNTLGQIGVGSLKGFTISDSSKTWDDFLQGDDRFTMAQQYVSMKVRLAFDPPAQSFVITMMQESIREMESRLNIAREYSIYGLPVTGGSSGGGTGPIPDDGVVDGGGPTSGGSSDDVLDGGAP